MLILTDLLTNVKPLVSERLNVLVEKESKVFLFPAFTLPWGTHYILRDIEWRQTTSHEGYEFAITLTKYLLVLIALVRNST